MFSPVNLSMSTVVISVNFQCEVFVKNFAIKNFVLYGIYMHVCMCMHVCIYACTYVCSYVSTYICTYYSLGKIQC